jgi:hypothetical protein
LWVLDKVGDREIAVIDVFVGTLTLIVALYLAFGPGANADSIKGAAFLLLFTFTYYWVAWNRWNGADGRGLGWFCLFVAITCAPIALQSFANAHALGLLARILMALLGCPLVFFFTCYLRPAGKGDKIYRWPVHSQNIYTGWIPGYLLLRAPCPADRHDAAPSRAFLPEARNASVGPRCLCRHARMMEEFEMPLYDWVQDLRTVPRVAQHERVGRAGALSRL